MAFISSAKHSRGNEDVNTASVFTASTNVPTASANIGVGLISQRLNASTSIRWVTLQGSTGLPKAKTGKGETTTDKENHALVADEEAPTEFTLMANISAERLAQVEFRLVEHKDREIKYCEKIIALEFKTESSADYIEILKKELETLKKEKEGLDGKIAGFQTASKDLDSLLESQRLDKNKEGLGYSVVPPPPAQIYCSPKKDMSWTGLPEFKDDTVTDYSRPAPTIESSPDDAQNKNPSVTETEASISTISPKYFIKFVKANDSPTKSKIEKAKKAKKSPVKYAKQYRKPTQKPNVRGNQRNWNNLKSHQLGPNFEIKKNACFNCGDFNHLAYDCRKRVKLGTSRSQNNTNKSFTPRPVVHKPYRPPMRPMRSNMNVKSQYRAPWVPTVNRNFPPVNRKLSTVSRKLSTINRKCPTANRKLPTGGTKFHTANIGKKGKAIKASYQALIPLDVPKNRIYYLIKSSAIFSAVASLFFWQWKLSSLAVGTSTSSGNSITGSENALCILFPTDHWNEMCYQLLKLMLKQQKKK
nr:ubiquitin hydrolase [Tanacetum cinerariifolium]